MEKEGEGGGKLCNLNVTPKGHQRRVLGEEKNSQDTFEGGKGGRNKCQGKNAKGF